MGSTFCAALANNSVDLAIGVDDWSQFTGPRDTFHTNLDTCVGGQRDRVSRSDGPSTKKRARCRDPLDAMRGFGRECVYTSTHA